MLLVDIEKIGHFENGVLDVLGRGSNNLDPVFIMTGELAKKFMVSGIKEEDKVLFSGKMCNREDGYEFIVRDYTAVPGVRKRKFKYTPDQYRETVSGVWEKR